jgi:hypothetical protein
LVGLTFHFNDTPRCCILPNLDLLRLEHLHYKLFLGLRQRINKNLQILRTSLGQRPQCRLESHGLIDLLHWGIQHIKSDGDVKLNH